MGMENMFIPLGLSKALTITQNNLALHEQVQLYLSPPVNFHFSRRKCDVLGSGWFSVTHSYRWKSSENHNARIWITCVAA